MPLPFPIPIDSTLNTVIVSSPSDREAKSRNQSLNLMDATQVFDDAVESEKRRVLARCDIVSRIVKLRQVLEVLAVCAGISWSSARAPEVFGGACACFAKLCGFLFNHHVVFLIGNAIIVVLCVLCRRGDESDGGDGESDVYDDCVTDIESILHSDDVSAAAKKGGEEPEASVPGGDDVEDKVYRFDDVAEAIDRAARQIKRFERTQSERLRRAIAPAARRSMELRRSETDIRRKIHPSYEIERLDGEEFRRAIDAFIDEHWNRKGAKQSEEFGEYQLVKVT